MADCGKVFQRPKEVTNQTTGNNKMINTCMVALVIVLLGIFAAGSCELAEERTERKRVEKWLKGKYSRTY